MFEIIWMAVIGLIVGVIAKILLPGKDPGGIIMTAIIGIAGSFIGTFIGRNVLHWGTGYRAGVPMAVVGSIILLVLYRVVAGRRSD
jgi:uncharacterized membrane protein YeaQ/YmgE (transglycosylase-associated protein family)